MSDNTTLTTASSSDALSLPELADRANEAHLACLMTAGKTLEHARVAGEALAVAKTKVPHGEWTAWLADNFQASARTAQVYTRIFRRWPEIASKAQATAFLTIEAAVNLISEPRPTRIPRTRNDLRPGPLPRPGMRLLGSVDGATVFIESHVDPAYVYPTILGPETEDGPRPAKYSQRGIPRDRAYWFLEIMDPNIDYDAIEWQEEECEPLQGYHPFHEPHWLYPDTGNERLNALEPIIRKRCWDLEPALQAIKEVQAEGLYTLFCDTVEDYLHMRFDMCREEMAGLLAGQEWGVEQPT